MQAARSACSPWSTSSSPWHARKSPEPMKVFLTGASSGIGEELARLYAARGATLGLVARRGDFLDRLKSSLTVPVAAYACDVRDAGAMRSAGADFIGRHGLPDLVIANAGVSYGNITM